MAFYTPVKNGREDGWDETVDANCKDAVNRVGAVLPRMLERGQDHIVTVSSDARRNVFPGLAVCSASTLSVKALSRGLRLETPEPASR